MCKQRGWGFRFLPSQQSRIGTNIKMYRSHYYSILYSIHFETPTSLYITQIGYTTLTFNWNEVFTFCVHFYIFIKRKVVLSPNETLCYSASLKILPFITSLVEISQGDQKCELLMYFWRYLLNKVLLNNPSHLRENQCQGLNYLLKTLLERGNSGPRPCFFKP